jgi:hypothetical protein
MVLPASTAAQGEAAQAEWLRQVRRWLHLGHKGVLVMIRDAQLAQLRPLVRMLETVDSSLTVTNDAPELLECHPGALALLIVRERDLGWLNLNRPIFEQRSLRVVLWVEPELSVRLKFESPDLHDWISHFVQCPEGVPDFAVDGLRIGSSWWPGVAWRGAGLELALTQLKIEVTSLRPDAEFESLVSTLSADRGANIRWVGVDSLRALWRVRWALAEARHHGFCVLDQPIVSTPGWFPVDSLQIDAADAKELIEGENRLQRVIELELEPAQLLSGWDDSVSEEVRVGLLLQQGPELRQRHDSPGIADWRRDVARAILQEPERLWSRPELAVFATLERDCDPWPSWTGWPKQRHSVEHLLRTTARDNLPELAAWMAASFQDSELIARWGSTPGWTAGAMLNGDLMWNVGFDHEVVLGAAEALAIGNRLGWDTRGAARATAIAAQTLLEQLQPLHEFFHDVSLAAHAELGPGDPPPLLLEQITAIAEALAGDHWVARNRLILYIGLGALPSAFESDLAAILVLCGEYGGAAQLLQHLVHGDSPVTRLYVAVLLAAGQPEHARTELERLIGQQLDPISYLGDSMNANERAREFLRARLHSLAHPDPT